jgi:beta-glucosidase
MNQPYRDASLPVQQRVEDLLSRMTLQEKIGQLNQIPARAEDVEQLKNQVRQGHIGSFVMASSAFAGNEEQCTARVEQLNELQKIAVEGTRLGIPILNGRDIIHGCRTVFPIPIGMAASFDPSLLYRANRVAAREARSIGVHWAFSPMMDIARDPRWGRIAEGFGEDPYLASRMAEAAVRGFQEPPADQRLLACAKHYLAYGAAEAGKDYNTTEVTDNTLLNTYAPPFIAAIRAGVASIMSSFNEIGGDPVTSSRKVMVEFLRRKFGFDGLVVTDWNSVLQLISHGVAADRADAARLSLLAENDLDMCSECYIERLESLVKSGAIPMDLVDRCVGRVLKAKFDAGLFERPYTDADLAATVLLHPDHRALAREVVAKSAVLLKNAGGLLPLKPEIKSIAILGPLCDEQDSLLGTWSMDGVSSDVVTLTQALREALPQAQIHSCPHLPDVMIALAKQADVVIMALGENRCRSGEDNSTVSLDLPPGQTELLEAIADLEKPIITVVSAGRPLVIPTVLRRSDALLWVFHPGVEAGHGIVDVLTGRLNPGGKMPVSLPRHAGQVPIYYNHKRTGRPFAKQHMDMVNAPLVPFGFGLSYTTFALRDLKLSTTALKPGQTLKVSATVQNTGKVAGDEVVQLYLRDLVSSASRPVRELKGFVRVTLKPGESREVSFTLGEEELGLYNLEGQFVTEPGEFALWVGNSSTANLEAKFRFA